MEFSHYDPVPKNVADEVIAEVAKRTRCAERVIAFSSAENQRAGEQSPALFS